MNIKLDENLGERGRNLFRAAGHEVASVWSQGHAGATDATLITVCKIEKRILVTLDMDYANPLLFPPSEYAGIVVLRPKRDQEPWSACRTLITALARSDPNGKLWVIQGERIREYRPEEPETGDGSPD